jgi:hypothetical protein
VGLATQDCCPSLTAAPVDQKPEWKGFFNVVAYLQISGKFNVDGSGNVDFKEEDGIDYAPVTVQLPGGERVPFLFTIKELQAKVRC